MIPTGPLEACKPGVTSIEDAQQHEHAHEAACDRGAHKCTFSIDSYYHHGGRDQNRTRHCPTREPQP